MQNKKKFAHTDVDALVPYNYIRTPICLRTWRKKYKYKYKKSGPRLSVKEPV